MGTRNLDIARFDVTGVFTHPDAVVDIVFLHGLNGAPQKTWTAKNGVYWPNTLLAESLKDLPVNILVYGYNADVSSRGHNASPTNNYVFQHAQTLVANLTAYRRSNGTSNNAIIWVVHSFGGILLKRALLYSNDLRDAQNDSYRSIYISTYGIVFLGTPHTGSDLATWGRILQGMSGIIPRRFFDSEPVLLRTLKRDSQILQEINSHFLDIYQRFKIQMVHENHKTDLGVTKDYVVSPTSASPQLPGVSYYGIEATHSGMCKFESASASGYRSLSTAIIEWVQAAPSVIEVRWTVENEEREARMRREIDERLANTSLTMARAPESGAGHGDGADVASTVLDQNPLPTADGTADGTTSAATPVATPVATARHLVNSPTSVHRMRDAATSPKSLALLSSPMPDPPFVGPEKLRPNSYFFGFTKELAELHDMLTDPKRRAEGTSAVVIWGMTGGGKSHFARQYVFQHRKDYPGGIFWVRAKSIAEMEQFYWRIAHDEGLHSLGGNNVMSASHMREPGTTDIVDIVKKWFCTFDRWLIVFDGILFNTPGIKRFIPDAKNTSLIYTSIQSGASGRWDFDNPQVIHLPLLHDEDARNLLLTEMERHKPWSPDDETLALAIVRLMGNLPLMIHIGAQHLKATREPLAKYLVHYRTRTPAGDLSAYRAVWNELKYRGASKALNLIYIMAFFDSRIPVGLLHLGIRALDNTTPVRTRDASHRTRSMSNSLRTLLAFALIERSQSDSMSPISSQSSSKLRYKPYSEAIDLLQLHTVVQLFFIDILAQEKQSEFWLERSASVFCRAFDEAVIRFSEKVGLLDDYRRFKIHGDKLLEHLVRMEKKTDRLPSVLAQCKENITSRLVICEAETSKIISHSYMFNDIKYSDDVANVSVFEQAGSDSDSGASTSASSRTSGDNSIISSRMGSGIEEDSGTVVIVDTDHVHQSEVEAAEHTSLDPSMDKGKAPMEPLWTSPQHAVDREMASFPICPSPELRYNPTPFSEEWDTPIANNDLVPYPVVGNPIPAPPTPDEVDESDGGVPTQVPTPRVPQKQHDDGSFQAGFGVLSPVLEPLSTHHRTVKRNRGHRYHDRAQEWRDNTISDPHVDLSSIHASGEMYYTPDARPRTEMSDNEADLSFRNNHLPFSVRAPGLSERMWGANAETAVGGSERATRTKSRTLSDGNLGKLSLQALLRSSRAGDIGSTYHPGIEEESEASSASGSSPLPPLQSGQGAPASSWVSTFRRMRDYVLPSHARASNDPNHDQYRRQQRAAFSPSIKSDSPAKPRTVSTLNINSRRADARSTNSPSGSPSGSMFQGSRTARSSPIHASSPFLPPRQRFNTYQSSLTVLVHQGENEGFDSHEATNILSHDPMTATQPFLHTSLASRRASQPGMRRPSMLSLSRQPSSQAAQQQQQQPQQRQQFLHPTGSASWHSSQPMSHNASTQSQPVESSSRRQPSILPPASAPSRPRRMVLRDLTVNYSHGPSSSYRSGAGYGTIYGSGYGRVYSDENLHFNYHPSSVIETDPFSQRTPNALVDTLSSQRPANHMGGSDCGGLPLFRPVAGMGGTEIRGTVQDDSSSATESVGMGVELPPQQPPGAFALVRSQSDMANSNYGLSTRPRVVFDEAVSLAGAWASRGNQVLAPAIDFADEPLRTGLREPPRTGFGASFNSEPMSRNASGNDSDDVQLPTVAEMYAPRNRRRGRVLQEFGRSHRAAP